MKKYEQVKMFSGDSVDKVEKQYNKWVKGQYEDFKSHLILSGMELEILDRDLVIRNYEGEETFALAVYYTHYELKRTQKGNLDKGAGGKVAGASVIRQQR